MKQFLKCPNGKVWLFDSSQQWIDGCVEVPYSDDLSLEDFLDAVSEEATGSVVGLTNFRYCRLGGDWVSFSGYAEEFEPNDSDNVDNPSGYEILAANDPRVQQALVHQYGLHDSDVSHAVNTLNAEYDDESVVSVLGTPRQIRAPAYPADCTYVRITVAGMEVVHWTSDEWKEQPEEVVGAILGCAMAYAHDKVHTQHDASEHQATDAAVPVKHWNCYGLPDTVLTHNMQVSDLRKESGQTRVVVGELNGNPDDAMDVLVEVATEPVHGLDQVPCAHVAFNKDELAGSLFKDGDDIILRLEEGVSIEQFVTANGCTLYRLKGTAS